MHNKYKPLLSHIGWHHGKLWSEGFAAIFEPGDQTGTNGFKLQCCTSLMTKNDRLGVLATPFCCSEAPSVKKSMFSSHLWQSLEEWIADAEKCQSVELETLWPEQGLMLLQDAEHRGGIADHHKVHYFFQQSYTCGWDKPWWERRHRQIIIKLMVSGAGIWVLDYLNQSVRVLN